MIVHHVGMRVMSLTGTAASSVVLATAVTDEHIDLIKVVLGFAVALVSATVGVMAWLDARQDAKVAKSHRVLSEKIDGTHTALMTEIAHLRELLAFAGVIPDHTPPAVRLARPDGTIPEEDR